MSTVTGKKWLVVVLVTLIACFACFTGLSIASESARLDDIEEKGHFPSLPVPYAISVLPFLPLIAALVWAIVVKSREERGLEVQRSKRVARGLLQWVTLLWLLCPFPVVDTGLVFSSGGLDLASPDRTNGFPVVLFFSPFITGMVFVALGLGATKSVLRAVFSGLDLVAAKPAFIMTILFFYMAGLFLMALGLVIFRRALKGIEATFPVSGHSVKPSRGPETLAKTREKLAPLPPVSVVAIPGLLFLVTMRLAALYYELSVLSALISILAGFALLVTAYLGWHGWRIVRICLGASKLRPVDITHLRTPPSPQTKPIIEALAELSFKRLGEIRTTLAVDRSSGITWILTNPQATVVAEVVEGNPDAMLLFSTTYADEAVVETEYPGGEQIKTASFRSHTIATSVQDAYEYQLEQVAEFSEQHGVPYRIGQMSTFLDFDAVYRLRHARRKMRRHLWMGIVHLAALGSSLVTLFMFLLLLWIDPSKELVAQRFWTLNLQIVLAAMISYLALSLKYRRIVKRFKETHSESPSYGR
ncbi:MAG: hypothetical protein JXA14_14225 [Anaerolineae bacterium]|nr:hypothetical protein [Anaerolineae bacterium]